MSCFTNESVATQTESSVADKPLKSSKFRNSFLYKLFHRKKEKSAKPEDKSPYGDKLTFDTVNEINDEIGHSCKRESEYPINSATAVTCEKDMEESDVLMNEHSSTPTTTLSRDSQYNSSTDSVKKARKLFFETVNETNKSRTPSVFDLHPVPSDGTRTSNSTESDSGCVEVETKLNRGSGEETFITIKYEAFKQIQDEVAFLKKQLANLQQLFNAACQEGSYDEHNCSKLIGNSMFVIRPLSLIDPCQEVENTRPKMRNS